MALSNKVPVKVAVLPDALASAPAARPVHGVLSLRTALPRLVLTGARLVQQVTTLVVSPSSAAINVGATTDVSAQAFDQLGNPFDTTFAWSSSDASIATVDNTGLVTGVAPGTATITATSNGVSDTCEVTISAVVASIALSPSTAIVPQGGTTQLTATALDTNGQPVSGVTIAWSSSDPSVATVDPSSGLVTGVAVGPCTITASAQGQSGSCALTVYDPAVVASVTVTPTSAAIDTGDTQQLVAQAFNAAGDPFPDATFSWISQSPSVATVDSTGLVTGVISGTATIFVRSNGAAASCAITVSAVSYASATFSTATNQGQVGNTDNGIPLVQLNGTLGQVSGGKLLVSSDDRSIVAADVGHVDVTVEADLSAASADQGVVVGVVDGNNYVAAHWASGSTVLAAFKYVNGVTTPLGSLDVGVHTGRLGLTRRGSEVVVSLGGVIKFSASDAALPAGTMAGAYGHGAIADNMDWSSPKYAKAPLSGTIIVATTGSDTGTGVLADPISQVGLLGADVAAGSDIQLRGGTYGDWVSSLAGTVDSPITVRPYQNERATIDGDFQSLGDYVEWWDLELMNSDTARISTQVSSNPTDISRGQKYPAVFGKFNKFINTIHHDHGDGLYAAQEAEGLEVDGAILYNNGWEGPTGNPGETKGYGKSIYTQNSGADKVFRNFAAFNSFSSNIQMFGTGDAIILGFQFLKGVIFGAGTPTPTLTSSNHEELDMVGATGTTRGNLTVDGCSIYQDDAIKSNVARLNAAGDPPGQPISLTNSIVKGVGLSLNENLAYTFTGDKVTSGDVPINDQLTLLAYRQAAGVLLTDNTIDSNTYAAVLGNQLPFFYKGDGNPRTFAEWQADTGFDADSTFVNGQFTGADIVVVPMKYTPGRALVHCFNWDSAATLDINLSAVLAVGDQYEVHHVYDVWGTPVVSGTYDGNPVTLAQAGYVSPTPIGYGTQPASQSPKFNVFLVRKVG